MKRGALNKIEKHYIDTSIGSHPIEEIASDLNRSKGVIQKYLDSKVEPETPTESVEPPKKPESQMFKLMGRKYRNEKPVVTTMTKAASELADSLRPSRLGKKDIQDSIHRPKD